MLSLTSHRRNRRPVAVPVQEQEQEVQEERKVKEEHYDPSPPVNTFNVLQQPEDNIHGLTVKKKIANLNSMKEKLDNLPELSIIESRISLWSSENMSNIAGAIQITSQSLNDGPGDINDKRMGIVSLSSACSTCGQIDCPGHYGYIKFSNDGKDSNIYNPAFLRILIGVLSSVCNHCGKLLISPEAMKKHGFNRMSLVKRVIEMGKYAQKGNKTLPCIRNIANDDNIIPCVANPHYVTTSTNNNGTIQYRIINENNKVSGAPKSMDINEVISILKSIPNEDLKIMGFEEDSHPLSMILNKMLVMPSIARPQTTTDLFVFHSNITIGLKTVLANANLPATTYTALENFLGISNDSNKTKGSVKLDPMKAMIQGKDAIMREQLMGKRTNYCGRTLAGPDPSLLFGEIGIPMQWQSLLTRNVKVNRYNIKYIGSLASKGQIVAIYPYKTNIKHVYKNSQIDIGDTVERWLQDGDYIIANRQPTLHKTSMMAYRVKLGPTMTIRSHISYTTPMNLDYDGDENNVWLPRDLEVEAELITMLNVTKNLMSGENNKPSMGLVMNSITASYLLGRITEQIDSKLYEELIDMITAEDGKELFNERLIKYGVNPGSGRAVFSALLPSDFYYNRGKVIIKEGILFSGSLTKSNVGTSHRSIIQELYKFYGSDRASQFLTDAPRILNKWIIERGFTVGMKDIIGLDEDGFIIDEHASIIAKNLAEVYIGMEALGNKIDDPIIEAHRKRKIGNLVNIGRSIGLQIADKVLEKDNSIGIMTDQGAGTKGNIANVGQIMGSIGQQNYQGERLAPSITGNTRLLPSYDENDTNPEANAFIKESFYTGVTPQGLFFLQAGGREGILDTALKTAETGSMHHMMNKGFENIVLAPDGSIRNTIGTLFNPLYNNGFDTAEMVSVNFNGKPDFSSWFDPQVLADKINNERGWYRENVIKEINKNKDSLNKETIKDIIPIKVPNKINTEPYEIPENRKPPEPIIKLTRYEKARLLGARATQLANNAPSFIPLNEIENWTDAMEIAQEEYKRGLIPIYTLRKYGETRKVNNNNS